MTDQPEVLPWMLKAAKKIVQHVYDDNPEEWPKVVKELTDIIALYATDGLNSAEYLCGWADCAESGRIEKATNEGAQSKPVPHSKSQHKRLVSQGGIERSVPVSKIQIERDVLWNQMLDHPLGNGEIFSAFDRLIKGA